jgi:NNP family nitrate/nitrite transporter-like MFS transporter
MASNTKAKVRSHASFLFYVHRLTMDNATALYYRETFHQTTENAAAIASIYGWMNLFARGLGGYASDRINARTGMRGRLALQAILLACEGAMVLIYANTTNFAASIVVMTIFMMFVQMANGSCFAIVPYVDPTATGSVAGIVGAGGNVGGVAFGMVFRQLSYKSAFTLMGSIVVAASALTACIFIKGHAGLICGKDDPLVAKGSSTIAVPEKDVASQEDGPKLALPGQKLDEQAAA